MARRRAASEGADAFDLSFRGLWSNERFEKSAGRAGDGLFANSRRTLLELALAFALRAGVDVDLRTRLCLSSVGGTLNKGQVCQYR